MIIGMMVVMPVPIGGVVIMIPMIAMIIVITMPIVMPMVMTPYRPDCHSDDL